MKSTSKTIGKLLILGVLSAAPLFAQTGTSLTFTTSFPFYVGNEPMPAGTYTVKAPLTSSDLLLVQDADHTHAAYVPYVPTESLEPAKQGFASFNEYGDAAFLNAITLTGEPSGMEMVTSELEQKTASRQREQASNLSVPLDGVAAGN